MESYDYEIMAFVKIFELASGTAISIGQASPFSREGLWSFIKEVPPSPLSIKNNPYRGLVFEFDKTGVWINKSCVQIQGISVENNIVRSFISMNVKSTRYMPVLFLNDTIFCDKEHVEMIVGRILSSDRGMELQKAGTAPSQ